MRIDFVSDVACPWCAIGLSALERALERVRADIGEVELHMQPFELNPTMGAVIVDRKHLISGGQPSEVFERALREIAAGGGGDAVTP